MRTRTWSLVLAVATAAACDGGGGPSGVDTGGVPGTYRGRHIITITLGGQTNAFDCDGSIVITSTQGEAINGIVTVDPVPAGCEEFAESGSFTGTLAANGNLTIPIADLQELVDAFEELNCTVTRADPAFAGTLRSGRIQLRFTVTVVCPEIGGPDPIDIVWNIDVTKV